VSHSDKPDVFNLDAVKAEVDLTPFKFTFKGRPYEIPHLSDLDAFHMLTAFGEKGEAVGLFNVLRRALGDKEEQLRKAGMRGWQFNQLLKAWQKHAGVEPGESEGSTDS
jgi:hypothetical protein